MKKNTTSLKDTYGNAYEDYKKGILWLKSKIDEQLCQ